MALMGTGSATGENRAVEAAKKAISSRLLEDGSIQGARGVLINITGGHDLLLHEVSEASSIIHDAADPEANIIFGAVLDETMKGEVKITVIATGFERRPRECYREPPLLPAQASSPPFLDPISKFLPSFAGSERGIPGNQEGKGKKGTRGRPGGNVSHYCCAVSVARGVCPFCPPYPRSPELPIPMAQTILNRRQ